MSIVLSIMKLYSTVTSPLNQGKYLNYCLQMKEMSNQQITMCLRYYATFKVRKFESLFNKINASLQKTTTCIGLQAEQIFSVNM